MPPKITANFTSHVPLSGRCCPPSWRTSASESGLVLVSNAEIHMHDADCKPGKNPGCRPSRSHNGLIPFVLSVYLSYAPFQIEPSLYSCLNPALAPPPGYCLCLWHAFLLGYTKRPPPPLRRMAGWRASDSASAWGSPSPPPTCCAGCAGGGPSRTSRQRWCWRWLTCRSTSPTRLPRCAEVLNFLGELLGGWGGVGVIFWSLTGGVLPVPTRPPRCAMGACLTPNTFF